MERCEVCAGSQLRKPFSGALPRESTPFRRIHEDIWEAPVPSITGEESAVILVEDASSRPWVIPLKRKSNAEHSFDAWIEQVQN